MLRDRRAKARVAARLSAAVFGIVVAAGAGPAHADGRDDADPVAAALALQNADVQPRDLPLDAEGRSAFDGRPIAGVVPRAPVPADIRAAEMQLEDERAAIAEGQPADDAPVTLAPLDDGQPARFDAGDPDPDRQDLTTLPAATER